LLGKKNAAFGLGPLKKRGFSEKDPFSDRGRGKEEGPPPESRTFRFGIRLVKKEQTATQPGGKG